MFAEFFIFSRQSFSVVSYLLRTRIRAAVECLDQLYQHNAVGDIRINNLGEISYEEDLPSLENMV
jgi:hypothetical protein